MAAPIAHGGGLLAARRRWPGAPEPWIDLSTGINPAPYPVPPFSAACLARLPEPEEVAALERAAAAAYGVADPACVVAGGGTQALIHLLPRLLSPRRVWVDGPTYAEHAAAWALAGHRVVDALPAEVAVAVRPNNPDGRVRAALPEARLVVVDEAFADLEGCSLAGQAGRDGLLLLRSFGKTYGLAGVRLGFALAEPGLAAALRAAMGPWAVSGPAVAAGLAALPDAGWRAAAACRLAGEAARLDGLAARAGLRLAGGTRLFRLYEGDAAAVAERLGRAGVLARVFPERAGWIRLGIPAPGAWDRVAAALA